MRYNHEHMQKWIIGSFVLLAFGCTTCKSTHSSNIGDADPSRPTATQHATSDSKPTTLAPPPNAIEFCSGTAVSRPSPAGGFSEIHWRSHGSKQSIDKLDAHYRATLGTSNRTSKPPHSVTWRLPGQPARVLSLNTADQPGPWTRCKTPPEVKTIITISSMHRS